MDMRLRQPLPRLDEYISAQARALEHLEETKGKLTMDDKMFFAFCIYNIHIVRVYDEETGIEEFPRYRALME